MKDDAWLGVKWTDHVTLDDTLNESIVTHFTYLHPSHFILPTFTQLFPLSPFPSPPFPIHLLVSLVSVNQSVHLSGRQRLH